MTSTNFKNSVISLDEGKLNIALGEEVLSLDSDEVIQFFQLAGALHQVMNQIAATKVYNEGQ